MTTSHARALLTAKKEPMDNLNVKIRWIHYNNDPHNATGSIAGSALFTIKQVLPGAYRMTVNLPKATYGFGRDDADLFATSVDELKAKAEPLASRFYQLFAASVLDHPTIRYIDKVTLFWFPAQLCHEDCEFYGGTGQHEDITVEKYDDDRWIIFRPDDRLYVNPSQDWEEPTQTLDHPDSARFFWPLEEALEQAQFMHCG